jgi:hypothetical protein
VTSVNAPTHRCLAILQHRSNVGIASRGDRWNGCGCESFHRPGWVLTVAELTLISFKHDRYQAVSPANNMLTATDWFTVRSVMLSMLRIRFVALIQSLGPINRAIGTALPGPLSGVDRDTDAVG